MKSEKTSKIDKRNECVIDFYRLIDTIDINQIRFTDFYRFTTPGDTTIRFTQTYNHFTKTTISFTFTSQPEFPGICGKW